MLFQKLICKSLFITGGAKSWEIFRKNTGVRSAARSVLVVGRIKDDITLRLIAHDKIK